MTFPYAPRATLPAAMNVAPATSSDKCNRCKRTPHSVFYTDCTQASCHEVCTRLENEKYARESRLPRASPRERVWNVANQKSDTCELV